MGSARTILGLCLVILFVGGTLATPVWRMTNPNCYNPRCPDVCPKSATCPGHPGALCRVNKCLCRCEWNLVRELEDGREIHTPVDCEQKILPLGFNGLQYAHLK